MRQFLAQGRERHDVTPEGRAWLVTLGCGRSDDNWHRIRHDVLKQTRPDQQVIFLSNHRSSVSKWTTVTIESGKNMTLEFQHHCVAAAKNQRIWVDNVFIGQQP